MPNPSKGNRHRLMLRIPVPLWAKVVQAASAHGQDVNTYINTVLAERLAHRDPTR
jgi:predicted HicB family RNase H-like nuclease